MAWVGVTKLARQIYENASPMSRDVAAINLYQVGSHQGKPLTEEARSDVEAILRRNHQSPDFAMCCHILLGTVTREMIRRCLDTRFDDVLSWPIMRLIDAELQRPA